MHPEVHQNKIKRRIEFVQSDALQQLVEIRAGSDIGGYAFIEGYTYMKEQEAKDNSQQYDGD